MNFENWILIIYEPKTNIQKKKKNAKWSNFNSIEPNIAKWLYYIHQIQKKKTVKNKNYQFLNFLSNQTDFGSEKRNRECEEKKGKKKKKSKPGSERRLREGCKRLCLERKGTNRKRPMHPLSLPLSLSQKSLSMPMLSNNDNYIEIYLSYS